MKLMTDSLRFLVQSWCVNVQQENSPQTGTESLINNKERKRSFSLTTCRAVGLRSSTGPKAHLAFLCVFHITFCYTQGINILLLCLVCFFFLMCTFCQNCKDKEYNENYA